MKTLELVGAQLDWAVAKAEGELDRADFYLHESTGAFMLEHGEVSVLYSPSTKWAQGGPIIDRERITITQGREILASQWSEGGITVDWYKFKQRGPTPLTAAMRCYVTAKLGKDVELPKELL